MTVDIVSLLEGARRARGIAVIIDVYRAMTTTVVALARGATGVVMTPDIEAARRLREEGRGEVLAGEVDGKPIPGFDFGNSPFELSKADLRGKRLILSTRAGTAGVLAAAEAGATRIFTGAFINARATADAIRLLSPDHVTLVAMGWNADTRTDEDEICAIYLRNLIEGRDTDPTAVKALVLAGRESRKFGDPSSPWFHREDRDAALDIDRLNFAVEVRRDGGLLMAGVVCRNDDCRMPNAD
jgi:2-phosphosulfolactate phosphatase